MVTEGALWQVPGFTWGQSLLPWPKEIKAQRGFVLAQDHTANTRQSQSSVLRGCLIPEPRPNVACGLRLLSVNLNSAQQASLEQDTTVSCNFMSTWLTDARQVTLFPLVRKEEGPPGNMEAMSKLSWRRKPMAKTCMGRCSSSLTIKDMQR